MNIFANHQAALSAASNADQVEEHALIHGFSTFDIGLVDEIVSGELEDEVQFIGGNRDDWSVRDRLIEDFISDEVKELTRRSTLMGEAYPFTLNKEKLIYTGANTRVYEFCLLLSLLVTKAGRLFLDLSARFEELIKLLLVNHLGKNAKGYRVGVPRRPFDGAPEKLDDVAAMLYEETNGDFYWKPVEQKSKLELGNVGDLGIDYVVWIPFDKKRIGSLIVLGQCAAGQNWDTKYYDLNIERLGEYFRVLSTTGILRSFAIPYHIPDDGYFMTVNNRAGIALDRARIGIIAQKYSKNINEVFGEYIEQSIIEMRPELAEQTESTT